jgi:hypothetical protein
MLTKLCIRRPACPVCNYQGLLFGHRVAVKVLESAGKAVAAGGMTTNFAAQAAGGPVPTSSGPIGSGSTCGDGSLPSSVGSRYAR